VSPENAAEVDLTAFTRRLMAQVQADLRRPLVWGAVNHWNIDNPMST
jgi:type IV secretory pathway VirD2 relaxase